MKLTVEATNPQYLITDIATYRKITTVQLLRDVAIMSDSHREIKESV